jgi:hypothetical protein
MDMDIEALLDAHDPDQTGTYDRSCVRALLLSTLRLHASSGAPPSPARGPMASSSTGHARPSPAPSAAAAAAAVPVPNWSGFFKKSVEERREQVALLRPGSSGGGGGGGEVVGLTASTSRQQTAVDQILEGGGLSVIAADAMVENCIGVLSMPLGLGLNFVLNGTAVPAVPMATEEPSVIAACSGAAKLIASAGGFETSTTGSVMIGQIQLIGVGGGLPQPVRGAARAVWGARAQLIAEGNRHCASMVARGGGVTDIVPRVVAHRALGGQGGRAPLAPGALQVSQNGQLLSRRGLS